VQNAYHMRAGEPTEEGPPDTLNDMLQGVF